MAKWWLESKTVIVNVLMALVALAGFVTGPDFPLQIPTEYLQYVLLGVALVNVVLRFMTGQPLKLSRK